MKKLVLLSILLALAIIVLSAFTRLTNAGLACTDWPNCYASFSVTPNPTLTITAPQQTTPSAFLGAVNSIHKLTAPYVVFALGLLLLLIFINALTRKLRGKQAPIKLPFILLLVMACQLILGKWDVALEFLPLLVMGYLLVGFTLLCCLFILYLRLTPYRIPGGDPQIRHYAKFGMLAVVLLFFQIALGSWTSTNLASLECSELISCGGASTSRLDFSGAFSLPTLLNGEYVGYSSDQRMTMHVMHRFGAVFVFLYLCWLGIALYAKSDSGMVRRMIILMIIVLGVQVGLGVSNVLFVLPFTVAVLHSAAAACLLLVMVLLTYTMYRKY